MVSVKRNRYLASLKYIYTTAEVMAEVISPAGPSMSLYLSVLGANNPVCLQLIIASHHLDGIVLLRLIKGFVVLV